MTRVLLEPKKHCLTKEVSENSRFKMIKIAPLIIYLLVSGKLLFLRKEKKKKTCISNIVHQEIMNDFSKKLRKSFFLRYGSGTRVRMF